MLKVCQFGAGRIGAVHAETLTRMHDVSLAYVVDPYVAGARSLAQCYGAVATSDPEEALRDPEVGAVVIASATHTHVDLINASARAKKAIFCEKPIDLDLARVDQAIREVERAGVLFFIGFNRRFDPSFAGLKRDIEQGTIGKLETLSITSRDPQPPPLAYLTVSGGLFRDMMIHDFDMARWLLGEEPVELFASASVLVDQEIGRLGDVDTAIVVMRTASGKLCQIQNSRRAAYGYDQRVEAFGERGMLRAENHATNTVERWTKDGVDRDKPPFFFLERYREAYRIEMEHFVACARGEATPSVHGATDGRRALVLAETALESLKTGRAVTVPS